MGAQAFLSVCGCFCTTGAELKRCDRDDTIHKAKNICCLTVQRKCLLMPGLEGRPWGESVSILTSALPLTALWAADLAPIDLAFIPNG